MSSSSSLSPARAITMAAPSFEWSPTASFRAAIRCSRILRPPRNLWGSGGLNLLPGETSSLKHERGAVSAARIPNKPDSDGAQFFVCLFPQPTLDGQYTVFGHVTEGIEVAERISQAPVGADGMTETPVRILKVTIEKKKVEPFLNATPGEMRKTVTLQTTLGPIRIEMEPDWAPNHVRNFLKLVSTGWYDGTAFHRLVKGFVLQGGMANTRTGAAAHPADRWVHAIKGEFHADIKHVRGIVSMARTDDPDSATTSFFLMLGDAPQPRRPILRFRPRGVGHGSPGRLREGGSGRGDAQTQAGAGRGEDR